MRKNLCKTIALFALVLSLSATKIAYAAQFSGTNPPDTGISDGRGDGGGSSGSGGSSSGSKIVFPPKGVAGSKTNPFVYYIRTAYDEGTWLKTVKGIGAKAPINAGYQYQQLKKGTGTDTVGVINWMDDDRYTHVYVVTRYSDIYAAGQRTQTSAGSKYVYRDWAITGVDETGKPISNGFTITTKGTALGTGAIRTTGTLLEARFYTPGTYTITTVPYMQNTMSGLEKGYGYHRYSAVTLKYLGTTYSYGVTTKTAPGTSYEKNLGVTTSITIREDSRQTWPFIVTAADVVPPGDTTSPPTIINIGTPSTVTTEPELDVGVVE